MPNQLGIRWGRSTWYLGYWGSALVVKCNNVRARALESTTINAALYWGQTMVGASGASLTVIGELSRCPVLLNGYQYHVNSVVAELDTVDAILGMDFLTAYGVTIN